MPTNRIHKFNDIVEMELFLNGAIIGGDVSKGVEVVGKQLHFIAPGPVGNVTFTTGTDPHNPYLLRLKDLKAQIEAQAAGITVTSKDGRLVLKGSASGVVLHPLNAADANNLLGFDTDYDVVGKVYPPAAGVLVDPCWVWANVCGENTYVIYTWE